ARDGLELTPVLQGHFGTPGASSGDRRRLLGAFVRCGALLGVPSLTLTLCRKPPELGEPFARALIVAEHRGIELELDELTDAPQLRLRIGDQVLVAKLEIMAVEPARLRAGVLDAAAPEGRRLRHRLVRPHAAPAPRERDVAPVSDQVDEAGLG